MRRLIAAALVSAAIAGPAYAQGQPRVDARLIAKAASEVFGSANGGAGAAWFGLFAGSHPMMRVAAGLVVAALGGVAGALLVLAWPSGASGAGAPTAVSTPAPSEPAPRP